MWVQSLDKEPAWQCRRRKRCRFSPWAGKIPWRRAWQNPLQNSGILENSTDREAWRATVHRFAKSQTRQKRLSMHACLLLQTELEGILRAFNLGSSFSYTFFFFLIFVGLIFGHAMQHEGSFIPNQGSNPCSQHWTTRDIYFFSFFWIPLLLGNKPFSVFDGSTA